MKVIQMSKLYAVRRGRKNGIFNTWNECKKQTHGYSNAEYKSFNTQDEVKAYLNGKSIKIVSNKRKPKRHNSLEQYQAKLLNEINSGKYYAIIYTDGGCRYSSTDSKGHHTLQSDDKSAWAYLIEWRDLKEKKQQDYDGIAQYGVSHSEMEVTAMAKAIQGLINLGFQEKPLLFVSDSKYVVNSFNKGWLANWEQKGWKKDLKQKDLWQQIARDFRHFKNCQFRWCKGHSGIPGNEFVDEYVNKCMDDMLM